jgi:pyrimidine-nucleoside phosphorylase
MATTLRGLNVAETVALTQAMVESGVTLSYARHPVIDKHSSGGVGDTTSLIAVPLGAAAGLSVAKLAGRALGHTGGTIDKLEALPGVRAELSREAFVQMVERIGCAIAAQSAELVPADKKIYALRDRTATVPSVGLIAASIVSKKIAAGADAIVYDVKCGRGAFMQNAAQAKELAERIIAVTKAFKRRAHVLVTDMNQPLGSMIGDGLEALEAMQILRGERSLAERLPTLALRLTTAMLELGGTTADLPRLLGQGAAYEKFVACVAGLGGDIALLPKLQPAAPVVALLALRSGYIVAIDPVAVGEAARDYVNRFGPYAGIELLVQVGDSVEKGQPLLMVYGGDPTKSLREALVVDDVAPAPTDVVLFEL